LEPPIIFLELAARATLTNRGRRAFVRKVTKNLTVNLTELQRPSVEMGEPSRRTTISVALHQSGFYGRVARRKPLLYKMHMTTHLELQDGLLDKSVNVLQWPSQSPDLNPNKHLWRDLKIAVQRHSPSILTALERICREQWAKLPKYCCAKLVAS
jgi:hypothetical protein